MATVDPTLLLVVDLECTCDAGDGIPPEAMEIIEIGAVWVAADGEVLDAFGQLVGPTERPTLTPFASELTGIRQIDVDSARPLESALASLGYWIEATLPRAAAWGSWGAFDQRQLERECARKQLVNPLGALPHRNLKAEFAKVRKAKQVGVTKALEICGMAFEGDHHRALADARNIARIAFHPHGSSTARPRKRA